VTVTRLAPFCNHRSSQNLRSAHSPCSSLRQEFLLGGPVDDLLATSLGLFLDAFNEVHALALQNLATMGSSLHANTRYPAIEVLDSGMPSIGKASIKSVAPPDYEYLLRKSGIFSGPLSQLSGRELPGVVALTDFCKRNKLSWSREPGVWDDSFEVKLAVERCVIHALFRYGGNAPSKLQTGLIIRPYWMALFRDQLPLAIIVPVCLTHFEVARFRLDESTFITRISDPIQLSRSMMVDFRGGTTEMVSNAATHAFVATDWTVENTGSGGVHQALDTPGTDVFELIDQCFASLRIATGIDTGYAQVLFRPRGWQFSGQWDLPALYGSGHRRYPNRFDAFGWLREDLPVVSGEQLREVRRVFGLIRSSSSNKIGIALKRLNACLSRDDDVDALLDAIIGLEVLLGDGGEAVSFKLKMRAAGLAKVAGGRFTAHAAFSEIGKLYGERSKIVHGHAGKPKSNSRDVGASSANLPTHRKQAADYLRMILVVLMEHPRYLDPTKIDTELLMGFSPE